MLSAVAALALSAPLLIRRAEVDITPPELLPLGGYTERHGKKMEEGGDALYARCVEIERGPLRIAVVTIEMLTVPESLYREVQARLPADIHLFLQATHTHCAPDSQMLNERMTFAIPGIASYKRHWLTWYADKIAATVDLALDAQPLRPSQIEFGEFAVKANRGRRRPSKPNREATRVYASTSGRLDLLFGHYTAHPVIYGPEENHTRGDWPAILATKWGGMILNGDLGDTSPIADGKTAAARMDNFFRRFDTAEQFARPLETAWRSWDKVSWAAQPIRIDPKIPHPTFGKVYGVPPPLAKVLLDHFAPSTDDIAAFRIGSIAVVGIPGEPTSFLGSEIRAAGRRMGFESVLVCSHVNGWMGYLLDPKDYDRGGYEATLSFYGRNEAPKVVDAAIKALSKLR